MDLCSKYAAVLLISIKGGAFTVDLGPAAANDGALKGQAYGRPARISGGKIQVELDSYSGAVFVLPAGK